MRMALNAMMDFMQEDWWGKDKKTLKAPREKKQAPNRNRGYLKEIREGEWRAGFRSTARALASQPTESYTTALKPA